MLQIEKRGTLSFRAEGEELLGDLLWRISSGSTLYLHTPLLLFSMDGSVVVSDDKKGDVALSGNGCRLGLDDGAEGAGGVSVVVDGRGHDVVGLVVGGMGVHRRDPQRPEEGGEDDDGDGTRMLHGHKDTGETCSLRVRVSKRSTPTGSTL